LLAGILSTTVIVTAPFPEIKLVAVPVIAVKPSTNVLNLMYHVQPS
jgi:hypothetical protein